MNSKRRKPGERAANPPPLVLQKRDIEILKALAGCRVLTLAQVQALFFGSSSPAQERMQRLLDHDIVRVQTLPVAAGRSPNHYLLGKKGAEILRIQGIEVPRTYYLDTVKGEFLAHSSAISQLYITVIKACQTYGYDFTRWLGQDEIKSEYADKVEVSLGNRRFKVPVIPDCFLTVQTASSRFNFFVEVDRGSMTVKRYKAKMAGYIGYFKSGRHTARYHIEGIRVLTVAPSARRLDSLKAATEEAGGARRFWFALEADLTPETIFAAPVWQVAGDTAPQRLIS